MSKRFALIGCSKKKNTNNPFHEMVPARDLYCSDLFKKRVEHIESRGLPWFILSAKSGCISPGTPLRKYDHTILDKEPIDRAAWHIGAASQLIDSLYYDFGIRDPAECVIEIHAGKDYCEPLRKILQIAGFEVERPVEGMGIGQQLAYYTEGSQS